jgi:hypothetical protein
VIGPGAITPEREIATAESRKENIVEEHLNVGNHPVPMTTIRCVTEGTSRRTSVQSEQIASRKSLNRT